MVRFRNTRGMGAICHSIQLTKVNLITVKGLTYFVRLNFVKAAMRSFKTCHCKVKFLVQQHKQTFFRWFIAGFTLRNYDDLE